jgi:hypothetical protein
MKETITREEFKAATNKLLLEEMQNVSEYDKDHLQDPAFVIAVARMAARCYTKLEAELLTNG